ncbi:MAG: biotin synthase BioB [Dissulfuribacterales bacterium]
MQSISDDKKLQRLLRMPLDRLMSKALKTKLRHRQDRFSLCTIMNVKSGGCTEDCIFCAQSAHHKTDAPEYPLKSIDEILKEAEHAAQNGASRFSLVASGKGPSRREIDEYAVRIRTVQERIGISVCASLGIMDISGLLMLKQAGLTRYHHNLETSPDYFSNICTTHTMSQRIETIKAAQKAGLETCVGGIIGLGEDMAQRLSLALTIKKLRVDSVPLNILVPIPGTKLSSVPPIMPHEILRTVAMFRLMLPKQAIRIAGGRETLKELQGLLFIAGADAMLIGGYLTIRGRAVKDDLKMAEDFRTIWKKCL